MKESAEKDLEAAKPALESALAALNSITPKDIASLKALKNPPDIVKRIFDCVLLLRSVTFTRKRLIHGWARQEVVGATQAMERDIKSFRQDACLQSNDTYRHFP